MPSDTQMLEQVCYHPCGQEAEHHDRHRPRCVEIVNRLFAVPQVVSDIHQVVLSIDASFLESQEAAPGRLSHRFGSAADIHLGEDRFTVRLHRPFCDKKGCRNLLIALSLCHQL
jgi:hypothetical protein